jgi:hypothetical protein
LDRDGLGSSVNEIVRRFAIAGMLCLGFVALVAAPALAQTERVYTGVTPPVVAAVSSNTVQLPAPAAVLPFQVSGSATSAAAPQAAVRGLAFTGADIAGLVTIALIVLSVGIVLTRQARPTGSS